MKIHHGNYMVMTTNECHKASIWECRGVSLLVWLLCGKKTICASVKNMVWKLEAWKYGIFIILWQIVWTSASFILHFFSHISNNILWNEERTWFHQWLVTFPTMTTLLVLKIAIKTQNAMYTFELPTEIYIDSELYWSKQGCIYLPNAQGQWAGKQIGQLRWRWWLGLSPSGTEPFNGPINDVIELSRDWAWTNAVVSLGLDDAETIGDFETCCGCLPVWGDLLSVHIEINGGGCSSSGWGDPLETKVGSVGTKGGGSVGTKGGGSFGTKGGGSAGTKGGWDAQILERFQTRLFTASQASW